MKVEWSFKNFNRKLHSFIPCHLIDETSNETILYQTGNE